MHVRVYERFWGNRIGATGYDFGAAPIGNLPPPGIVLPKPLRWWSWDHSQRLRTIMAARDARLSEIVTLGDIVSGTRPLTQHEVVAQQPLDERSQRWAAPMAWTESARPDGPEVLAAA